MNLINFSRGYDRGICETIHGKFSQNNGSEAIFFQVRIFGKHKFPLVKSS